MGSSGSFPRLILPDWFGDQQLAEMTWKGYLNVGIVERQNGGKYLMYFIDPVRLGQDIEAEATFGRPWVAEPNMVVLSEVRTDVIAMALEHLESSGFFDKLGSIASAGPG